MPLKLVPPRSGKSPNYSIRGTYLGIYIERTAGTSDKKHATAILRRTQKAIERGDYAPAPEPVKAQPTFADAALAYLKAGGEPNYIGRIIELTGPHALRDMLIKDVDQIAIDNAANALYPTATPATRNRQFYTPVSAVLKRAGIERKVQRPKGWRGSKATQWLEPEQAFPAINAAYNIDPEFGLLCLSYLYTGMRLSDPLRARLRDLRLDQAMLYIPDTKNGEPRPVHLPPIVVEAFRSQPPRSARPRKLSDAKIPNGAAGRSRTDADVPFLERSPNAKLFRFNVGGHLRAMLTEAFTAAGLSFEPREGGFHIFCHTYGTWMHRYGSLDTVGLTRTGRWKDIESAERYMHTKASEEARRADLLPVAAIGGKSVGFLFGKKKEK